MRTCTSFRLSKSYNKHIVGARTVNTSDFSTSWIKCSLQSFDSHFSNLPSNFWVIIFLLRRFLNCERIFSWYYIQEFQSLERPLINQSPLGLVNECLRADSPEGESYTWVFKPLGLNTPHLFFTYCKRSLSYAISFPHTKLHFQCGSAICKQVASLCSEWIANTARSPGPALKWSKSTILKLTFEGHWISNFLTDHQWQVLKKFVSFHTQLLSRLSNNCLPLGSARAFLSHSISCNPHLHPLK